MTTLDAIRKADAEWAPRCNVCDRPERPPEGGYGIQPRRGYPDLHPFTYDPSADTSPEAHRRLLLAVVEAAAAWLRPDPDDDPLADDEWDPRAKACWDALAAIEPRP